MVATSLLCLCCNWANMSRGQEHIFPSVMTVIKFWAFWVPTTRALYTDCVSILAERGERRTGVRVLCLLYHKTSWPLLVPPMIKFADWGLTVEDVLFCVLLKPGVQDQANNVRLVRSMRRKLVRPIHAGDHPVHAPPCRRICSSSSFLLFYPPTLHSLGYSQQIHCYLRSALSENFWKLFPIQCC